QHLRSEPGRRTAVVPSPQPRSKTLSPLVIPSFATSASPLSRMLSAMRVKSPFSQRALFGFTWRTPCAVVSEHEYPVELKPLSSIRRPAAKSCPLTVKPKQRQLPPAVHDANRRDLKGPGRQRQHTGLAGHPLRRRVAPKPSPRQSRRGTTELPTAERFGRLH